MSASLLLACAGLDIIGSVFFARMLHKDGRAWRTAIPLAWATTTICVAIGYYLRRT